MKDALKCATTNSGALYVMMDGELLTLTWLADKLDSPDSVGYTHCLTEIWSPNIVVDAQ